MRNTMTMRVRTATLKRNKKAMKKQLMVNAETTEDADAMEWSKLFMLFSLAENHIPYSWGCVRLELISV